MPADCHLLLNDNVTTCAKDKHGVHEFRQSIKNFFTNDKHEREAVVLLIGNRPSASLDRTEWLLTHALRAPGPPAVASICLERQTSRVSAR